MKIGIVAYKFFPVVGGAEAYLHDLHGILSAAGHSVTVYQARSGERHPGIHSLPKLPAFVPKLIAFDLVLPLGLPRLVREDIVIISYPEHFPPIFWHPRTIVISHGSTWTHEPEGVRKDLRMLSARWAYRKAKGFVFNDTFTLRELGVPIKPGEMAFSQVTERRWYIPNCVDTGLFTRRPGIRKIVDKKPILVPRNFTYPRGIDLALEAFSRLLDYRQDVHLLLAGEAIRDMPESIRYEQELRSMVERLSLHEKVSFIGRYSRSEMPAVYSSALVTLIPSRMSEGTSLAALESMACGTPVVTTHVEGLMDIPGLKCLPTPDGIVQGLRTALETREELATEQQKEVREKFDRKLWEKGWLRVIEEVSG